VATIQALIEDLTDDGYVYRFRQQDDTAMHDAEGAVVLSGVHLALAHLERGDLLGAARWFERNRSSLGPPGLFTEEYDVVERQLRGNLPQAFVHALLLETAQRLGQAGLSNDGFTARRR
jgi:GH15 family glucan-1,4-alpha-glucosidase